MQHIIHMFGSIRRGVLWLGWIGYANDRSAHLRVIGARNNIGTLLFHFALPRTMYAPACQKQKNIGTFFPYSLLDTFGVLFATNLSRFC